ncbi:MAG: PQQ-binding-like beta-propeller repeat protein [Lentisphaerae bacterium]|nr:PQQ-binding-like beta-propeller repeat protein [Lentisphaerota bacterium]
MRLFLFMMTTLLLAGGASRLVRWWQDAPPAVPVSRREPAAARQERRLELTPGDHCNRLVTTFVRHHPEPPPAESGPSWPGFRGPDRDAIRRDSAPLANAWPAAGPPRLWAVEVGDGHAGPAVYAGCVYLLDYDEAGRADVLRCLALSDGREIWRRSYPVVTKRNHGMSRTVPAVTDDCVVSVGPQCQVMCVDRVTGDLRWGLDLALDYGTTVPLWYTAQCPLILDGLAILAPCGKDLMMALDTRSGEVVWRTPCPPGWAMSHSSITPMTFQGETVLVYAALGGIAAVRATGPERGRILWSTDAWNKRIMAPCPVQLDEQRLMVTAGHGAGSAILHLARTGNEVTVERVTALTKQVFASEQQTPLWLDGVLYTVLPKDAGEHREELTCYDPSGAGRVLWTSGKDHRFGLGPYLAADGKILIMDDRGLLSLVAADRAGFRLLARHQVLPEARDAWGPPALVGTRLILRDSTRLICLDIGKSIEPGGS